VLLITDQYAVRFVPRENGLHLVHLRVNNKPLRESPYRVIVGTQVGDASLVHASGDGLLSGYVGKSDLHCIDDV
jgi:filamin